MRNAGRRDLVVRSRAQGKAAGLSRAAEIVIGFAQTAEPRPFARLLVKIAQQLIRESEEAASIVRSQDQHTYRTLVRRLDRAGFSEKFVRAFLLPDWWEKECAGDSDLLPELEIRVARLLGLPLSTVRDPAKRLAPARSS